MKSVTSYSEFLALAAKDEKSFLLLYKNDSEPCDCAVRNLEKAGSSPDSVPVYIADVSRVRDIHPRFGITTVPSLLVFAKGEYENTVKGCHDEEFYRSLMESAFYQGKMAAEGKSPKHVTVYTTPTCSWCNTLKTWLRKNHVQFSEIDISRDEKAASALVGRSGQQGVPQTDVNGQIVVGFNQSKLKELLEIQ